jgi:5-formyltetrahydrofolate cyclo-ligase
MGQEDKRMLRKAVRTRLAAMSDADKEQQSTAICHSLKAHIAVTGARVVALFSPLHDEPRIMRLVNELSLRLSGALPRVEGDVMRFYCYSPESLRVGAFGIDEPLDTPLVEPWEIDLMVVPGVAFTNDGARMGRGKGFYDKYMSHCDFRAHKVGVCFREQLVDNIPTEPHDIRMDCIISK